MSIEKLAIRHAAWDILEQAEYLKGVKNTDLIPKNTWEDIDEAVQLLQDLQLRRDRGYV